MECELLGRKGSFSWWLQVFLIGACMTSLVGKRFTDTVRRPWKVWFFDSSKQGVQAAMVHFINIGLSVAFGEFMGTDSDPCNWYWINLTLDCTFGVAIIFLLLRLLQWIYCLKCVGRPELARCGDYGDPPSCRLFLRQLFDYQALVLVQKLMLGTLVVTKHKQLASVAELLLGWLDPHPRMKLVAVMVVTPLCLNIFAFWTADNFLQASTDDIQTDSARDRLAYGGRPAVVGRSPRPGDALDSVNEVFGDDDVERLVSFKEWKLQSLGKRASFRKL